MENAKEFLKEHGKTLRMTLRNSKLSTDKLEKRISLMRKSFKDNNEDITRLDKIERKIRSIIDNTGKDQFSEEEIDMIIRQTLGLEKRKYDKSYLVNLDDNLISSIDDIIKEVSKTYPFGNTQITLLGRIIYTNWEGMQDLAGLCCYKILSKDEDGKDFEAEVFSRIKIGEMKEDADYRAAVLDVLLDKENIDKTNCGGYIGEIKPRKEVVSLKDTVPVNSRFSLEFNDEDATVVAMIRNILKERRERENKQKQDDERQ